MTKIYIARHGQNEDNANGLLNGHRDLPLTEIGLKQAKDLATHIKQSGLHFDRIYGSPLCRAYKTAEIVAETLGMEKPEKLDLIIERDFGVLTGRPYSDIDIVCGDNVIKTETVTYFLTPEGAETFPQLLERAKCAISFVEEHNKDKSVLLVCHGDFGKMLYAAFYGKTWEDALRHFHFGNGELILLDHECDESKRHVLKLEQFNH